MTLALHSSAASVIIRACGPVPLANPVIVLHTALFFQVDTTISEPAMNPGVNATVADMEQKPARG